MPSPFPGMDPYLEGHLWPDVHQSLAVEIRRRLAPALRPRYVARIEVALITDASPELEIGIPYPDVEVLRRADEPSYGQVGDGIATRSGMLAPPLSIHVLEKVELRVTSVQVRDRAGNELVTSIEILSPVNKREPELARHRRKRVALQQAGVHVVELDLLRRGARSVRHPRIPPDARYLILLTRAGDERTGVWPLALADPLPQVPIPLRAPDADVALDLAGALTSVYDQAAYDLEIDYLADPPPPEASAEDRRVIDAARALLAAR